MKGTAKGCRMNTKAEAAEPAEFSVSDRIQLGACLALTHVADTWGSQEARGDYLLFPSRRRYLLNELQIAIRAGRVRLFDAIGKRERGYRDDDADAVQRGVAQVLPASVNAWLEADGLPMLEQVERLAVATPEPVAAPAEAVPALGAGVVKHTTKTRRDPLAAVFARAKSEATDSTCPYSVWAALVAMATGNYAPPELTDYRDDKGLQATGARGGWLSKSAFLDRWRRGRV